MKRSRRCCRRVAGDTQELVDARAAVERFRTNSAISRPARPTRPQRDESKQLRLSEPVNLVRRTLSRGRLGPFVQCFNTSPQAGSRSRLNRLAGPDRGISNGDNPSQPKPTCVTTSGYGSDLKRPLKSLLTAEGGTSAPPRRRSVRWSFLTQKPDPHLTSSPRHRRAARTQRPGGGSVRSAAIAGPEFRANEVLADLRG